MWIYVILFPSITMYVELLLPLERLPEHSDIGVYILLALPQLLLFTKPSPFWPTIGRILLAVAAGHVLFELCLYYNVFDLRMGFSFDEFLRGVLLIGGLNFMTLLICYGLMRRGFPWLKQVFTTQSGQPT